MSVPAATAGVNLRGMDNNVLTQIGMIVLVALAAKNAILIIEFARQGEDLHGLSTIDAAVHAARQRLRPILMTSFAFILGSVPLVIATGAGAELRQALGTAVFFGMLGVTAFGLIFTPTFLCRQPRIGRSHRSPARRTQRQRRPRPAARRIGVSHHETRSLLPLALLWRLLPRWRQRARRGRLCRTPPPPPTSSGPFLSQSAAVLAAPVAADWWKLYNDPVLDGLIQDALKANTDIRVAVAHLEKARAALSGARSDRLPQGNLGAGATYGRVPVTQRAPGAPQEDWSVDAGLNVSYEVDLFGRVKRSVEAARGDAQAAEADAEAVRIAVIADTTRAYADAASGAAQLKVANHIVQLLDQLVDLTKRRHAAGFATQLDEARVVALREQRAADIPALEAQRQAALFRLATLTGRTPADLPEIATQRSIGLEITQAIPVGDGAALLARRPDIRAAERRLSADTARIGVATADLYPKISLGGSIGSTGRISRTPSGRPAALVARTTDQLEPQPQCHAREDQRRQGRQPGRVGDVRRHHPQRASGNGDGTLDLCRSLDRRRSLLSARNFAEQAATIARTQQKEGAIDALQLLDTERTFADAQAALALQDAQVSAAQIDLFKALGGGWSRNQLALAQ